MSPRLILHQHPFASFCWKPLIALYELELPFEPLLADADGRERLARLWPMARIPVLEDLDAGVAVFGSSAVVEHADALAPGGGRLLPADDPALARRARMWDRIVDDYVQLPMQAIVADSLRPADARDPFGVEQARSTLDTAYALLDDRFATVGDGGWLAGDRFTIADCAAVPALFYARAVHPWTSSGWARSHARTERSCDGRRRRARSTRRGPTASCSRCHGPPTSTRTRDAGRLTRRGPTLTGPHRPRLTDSARPAPRRSRLRALRSTVTRTVTVTRFNRASRLRRAVAGLTVMVAVPARVSLRAPLPSGAFSARGRWRGRPSRSRVHGGRRRRSGRRRAGRRWRTSPASSPRARSASPLCSSAALFSAAAGVSPAAVSPASLLWSGGVSRGPGLTGADPSRARFRRRAAGAARLRRCRRGRSSRDCRPRPRRATGRSATSSGPPASAQGR